MFRNGTQRFYWPLDTRAPLVAFVCLAAGLAVVLTVAGVHIYGSATVPLIAFAGAVIIAGFGIAQYYPHRELGWCNVVTLARTAMVAFLTGAFLAPDTSAWLVFGVATLAFALDGVDGWLARRSGLCSRFGARFDMETDAGLAAFIALWVWVNGITGPEVLILGFIRYGFVLASVAWPALQADLPDAFRRKVICVIQISVLVALIFPWTPLALATPMVIGAALVLVWSFVIDILWLIRRAV